MVKVWLPSLGKGPCLVQNTVCRTHFHCYHLGENPSSLEDTKLH